MFVVIVVWFCCSSRLAFLIKNDLIILMRHFCYSNELFTSAAIFVHTHFFEKCLNFWGCLSVPHLIDIYARNLDGRGRIFVCNSTLLSLLVQLQIQFTRFDVLVLLKYSSARELETSIIFSTPP